MKDVSQQRYRYCIIFEYPGIQQQQTYTSPFESTETEYSFPHFPYRHTRICVKCSSDKLHRKSPESIDLTRDQCITAYHSGEVGASVDVVRDTPRNARIGRIQAFSWAISPRGILRILVSLLAAKSARVRASSLNDPQPVGLSQPLPQDRHHVRVILI